MLYSKLLVLFLATVQAIPLPQDTSSSQCVNSYTGEFGFSTTEGGAGQAGDGQPSTQMGDGQANSGGASQMGDGQVNSEGASQMGDGQVNSGAASQISDGQPQSGDATTQISDGQPQSGGATTQISDGQPQSGGATTQISDGQPQASTQISDGQVQQGSTQMSDGQVNSGTSGSGGGGMTACKADNSLTLTLDNGILKDGKGRIGYIASNYQFQFDNPVQSGALKQDGFSICDGKIALDGSTKWYACLSGDFYNLYDRNWAAQCKEVAFSVVTFQGSC